jgi:hypothetical protein
MTRERSAVERRWASRRYIAWLPVIASVCAATVALAVAAAMIFSAPQQDAGLSRSMTWSQYVVALMVVVVGLGTAVLETLTARLFVGAEGIMFWRYFRRVRLRWADIRSFEVVRARSMGPWSEVLVRAISGDVHLHGTIGTVGHASRLAQELIIDHARAGGGPPESVDSS